MANSKRKTIFAMHGPTAADAHAEQGRAPILAMVLRQHHRKLVTALPVLAILLVILILFASGAWRQDTRFAGQAFDPATPVQNFTLTDQHGSPWRLSDQSGKAVIIYFGYTHCPDVCPATLSIFRDVAKQLGEDASRVRFVFITINPEQDTPSQLLEFLNRFDASFVGLTGTDTELDPIYRSWGVYRKQSTTASNDDHGFTHSSQIFGVDPHGNLRVVHDDGDDTEAITHDIRLLLKH